MLADQVAVLVCGRVLRAVSVDAAQLHRCPYDTDKRRDCLGCGRAASVVPVMQPLLTVCAPDLKVVQVDHEYHQLASS